MDEFPSIAYILLTAVAKSCKPKRLLCIGWVSKSIQIMVQVCLRNYVVERS